MRIDTTVKKGCPQGSLCGPGYWNIQYNSLLKLNFAKWTRAIAFADDLPLAVKAATVAEMENFTKMEMIKITKLSKENKLHFNNQKSKVVLTSRRRVYYGSDLSSIHFVLFDCTIYVRHDSTRPS